MIEEVRGRLRHPQGVARWTQPPPLAGEGYPEVVAALGTSGVGEADNCTIHLGAYRKRGVHVSAVKAKACIMTARCVFKPLFTLN